MLFRLSPDVAIAPGVRSKVAGEAMSEQDVEFLATRCDAEVMLSCARLLGDAMKGDAILFARQDAIEAWWRVVDGILHGATPVYEYDRGTWGAEADRAIARLGGWHRPQPKDCT
jgi:glucose-6-phosphate 1-dehydrogenase